ncbi:11604_t:CDS:2, partial [Dentiscutata heterogama]
DQLKVQESAISKYTSSIEVISEEINIIEDTNSNEEINPFKKFQKGYCAAKNLSENKLVSFVYQHANSPITVRSGMKIPVQVASVQRRKKVASHSTKRKASGRKPLESKENEDPHEMQSRKKRKTIRKPHNLVQNIDDKAN